MIQLPPVLTNRGVLWKSGKRIGNNLNPKLKGGGINDLARKIRWQERLPNGKIVKKTCPYYIKWYSMINRVYGKRKDRVYSGISIHEEWRYLSKFIEWVDSQPNKDWRNCDLDKDILIFGNKHYSPETCVFITSELNVFATERSSDRGEYLIGVDYIRKSGKYRAQCSNPWGETKSERRGRIGLFLTEEEAHFAWKAKKHEYSCKWADLQSDPRVAQALRTRYADLTTPYIP